jgi:protein TonB
MRQHISAGHLSLEIANAQAESAAFSFDRKTGRLSLSLAASVAADALIVALLFFASRYGRPAHTRPADALAPTKSIVWLSAPGPGGGGGGGGGNRMQAPPRRAELPGKDSLTVPIMKPPKLEQQPAKIEPNPLEQLNIPAKELAAAVDSLPGALEAPPGPPTLSQGSGAGGGAGSGAGSGIGPGRGSGLGPGTDGGTGGGAYRPGNGVTNPVVLREVRPAYTSDAMRARIQGAVLLEGIVRPDGSVADLMVIRSLDSMFGLDLEAMKAARQWRFRPGTRLGEPVPVLVTIQLEFTLR